jgi:uncharacterized protein
MSELIDNTEQKKRTLKELIRELHATGHADEVQSKVAELMGDVPYGLVVEVEQELISEGLPQEEILNLCDLHSQVLRGSISHEGARTAESGHPVHTFMEENRALEAQIDLAKPLLEQIDSVQTQEELTNLLYRIRSVFNELADVDKHYRRKENLVFPYLERYGITGPPTVMWGKHDQIREQMKAAFETLGQAERITIEEVFTVSELVLKPAVKGIQEMIFKEEQILFPMCLDRLTDVEWHEIFLQSSEIGFCLYDPKDTWAPKDGSEAQIESRGGERIQLPTGSFTVPELMAFLNTLPFDCTFVDKDDTVRYFTQGTERIFDRNRAILGRKVQMCHPPHSVHIVEQIVGDFKSGTQDRAAFWITLGGKFVHIEYFAMRGEKGEYLGTLEVTQDLTQLRALEGEQRLLTYDKTGNGHG